MARILHTFWSFESHVPPHVAVGRALRETGHEVAFYAASRSRQTAEDEGFTFFPFGEVDQERADRLLDRVLALRRRPLSMWRPWRELLLGDVAAQVTDLRQVSRGWRPDVIVCDISMLGPVMVLQEADALPVAFLSHVGYCIVPNKNGPVLGHALSARTPMARLAAWVIDKTVSLVTASVSTEIDELRRGFGLPPARARVLEMLGRAPLFLVPSVPELDPSRVELPASVQYVGACLWPQPETARPWQLPSEGARPHVVVYEGSLHPPEMTLISAAARGLAGSPVDATLIPAADRDPSVAGLPGSHANVAVKAWRPLAEVPGPVSVVVTNGDTEPLLLALSLGTPLVVVPSMPDQNEMAWRVQESGAGIRLPESRCTPRRLRAAVETVLGDPSYRANAKRLAKILSRYDGPLRAAELLTSLAIAK